MSIASMFWNVSPYTVQFNRFEEVNVVAKPVEEVKEGNNCLLSMTSSDYDLCVRQKAESNMYNSTFASLFCTGTKNAFGNCTIPQVIHALFTTV